MSAVRNLGQREYRKLDAIDSKHVQSFISGLYVGQVNMCIQYIDFNVIYIWKNTRTSADT